MPTRSVKRMFLVLAATVVLLIALAGVAGAQTAYPPDPGAGVGAGGAGRSGAGSALALTGDDTLQYAIIGGTALLLGGGLIVTTRRRQTLTV